MHKEGANKMCTINKITEIMEEKGFNQKDLTDYLGIHKNVYTGWKSGRIKSYKKYLPQIAAFLDVSVDYLLGMEEKKEKTTQEDGLTESQRKLIAFAKSVPDDKVDLVLKVMQSIVEAD